MKKWVTAVAVVAAIVGVGLLVYWQWDPIWSFVLSPFGGFVAKLLFTGKVLKVVAVAAFAAGAGWVAMRRKLRRGTPAVEEHHAPPVFGPPEDAPSGDASSGNAPSGDVPSGEQRSGEQPPPAAPAAPYAPRAGEALTSAGTAAATTTEPATAPASRPI